MTTYVHKCPECEHTFEEVRPMAKAGKLPACPECDREKCPQVFTVLGEGGRAHVKVISAGDETTVVLNDDGTPYRFKSGDEKGQKAELKRVLEQREAHLPERLRNVYNIT